MGDMRKELNERREEVNKWKDKTMSVGLQRSLLINLQIIFSVNQLTACSIKYWTKWEKVHYNAHSRAFIHIACFV